MVRMTVVALGNRGKQLRRNDFPGIECGELLPLPTVKRLAALGCLMRLEPDLGGFRQRRSAVLNILLIAVLLWALILLGFATLS